MFVMHTAERVIATLRAHEEELRQAGLRSLSLFGSLARGETEMDSDIDLAAEFDPAARMDLLRLSAVERRIAELLGSPVDLLPEPVEKRRLQDQINRDRGVPSKHDPVASLADILENLERIEGYVAGLDREAFGGDTLRRDAVER
jgi:predicted nucleotidyltransferase